MEVSKKLKKQIIKQTKEVLRDVDLGIKKIEEALAQARLNKATAEAILRGL